MSPGGQQSGGKKPPGCARLSLAGTPAAHWGQWNESIFLVWIVFPSNVQTADSGNSLPGDSDHNSSLLWDGQACHMQGSRPGKLCLNPAPSSLRTGRRGRGQGSCLTTPAVQGLNLAACCLQHLSSEPVSALHILLHITAAALRQNIFKGLAGRKRLPPRRAQGTDPQAAPRSLTPQRPKIQGLLRRSLLPCPLRMPAAPPRPSHVSWAARPWCSVTSCRTAPSPTSHPSQAPTQCDGTLRGRPPPRGRDCSWVKPLH